MSSASRAPDGAEQAARGFFCRLRLEPYGPGSGVLPHEHTMAGPKEDRFRLMSAVKANLSPVLFLYEDGAAGATAGALMERLVEATSDRGGGRTRRSAEPNVDRGPGRLRTMPLS